MQSQSNKRLMIIGFIVVLLIIIASILAGHYSSKKAPPSSGDYYDPLSHQTVSDPAGKAPDKYGTTTNMPTFLGLDTLLDRGLTYTQLNNLKTAFYKYSAQQPNPLKEVSVDVDHVKSTHDPTVANSPFGLSFTVGLDRDKTYTAKVEYTDLISVRLILTDSQGRQIYDSGNIGSSSE